MAAAEEVCLPCNQEHTQLNTTISTLIKSNQVEANRTFGPIASGSSIGFWRVHRMAVSELSRSGAAEAYLCWAIDHSQQRRRRRANRARRAVRRRRALVALMARPPNQKRAHLSRRNSSPFFSPLSVGVFSMRCEKWQSQAQACQCLLRLSHERTAQAPAKTRCKLRN